MRAVVHDRYGPPDVLRIEDVQRPVPAEDELLVRVHATTVTQTDCHMRAARPFVWRFMLGLRRPRRRTLGLEFAGVVEDVGSAVTQFAVGGRVFGLCSSAHAEYVCVRESRLVAAIPAGMSFEEAAAVCDGMSHVRAVCDVGRMRRVRSVRGMRRMRLHRHRTLLRLPRRVKRRRGRRRTRLVHRGLQIHRGR